MSNPDAHTAVVRLVAIARVAWQEATDPEAAKRISEYVSAGTEYTPLLPEQIEAALGPELANLQQQAARLHEQFFALLRKTAEDMVSQDGTQQTT